MTTMIPMLREAPWLHAGRALAWIRILAVVSALAVLALLLATHGGSRPDPWGRPLGTDFVSFWSVARLALAGTPAAAWDPAIHAAMQRPQLGTAVGSASYYAFFYPPPFLLACLPLGLLPFNLALAAWLLPTTALFCWAICRLLPRSWPRVLIVLAFPAVVLNAGHGQNGALSAGLMATAALLLDRRPRLAGLCLGLLCFKPQLALPLVPALVAARRWRALGAAAAGAGALCLLSWLVLGAAAWRGFLLDAPLAARTLTDGLVGFAKMTSPFAGLRLAGATIPLAWVGQAAASAAALGVVVTVGRRRPGGRIEMATTAAAACLATPFLLDYDLMLLAVPLAVMADAAHRRGVLPWERCILAGCYVLPLVARPLAMGAGLPVAPFAVAALLAALLRRHGGAGRGPGPDPYREAVRGLLRNTSPSAINRTPPSRMPVKPATAGQPPRLHAAPPTEPITLDPA